MDHIRCPVCGSQSKLKFKLKFNVYKCPDCGLYTSDACFDFSFKSNLDLASRDIGLKKLRFENFETIAAKLSGFKNGKIKGLEIGSGNGWWLKVCKEKGIDCIGIEPEKAYQGYHQANGLDVRYGFYPAPDIKTDAKFDFIIFNDVFEHITVIDNLVTALKKDLDENGLLIINLPMSDGFFFRTAVFLKRLGIKSSLERLWQFNFHSPHMNYFNQKNLEMFLSKHGLKKEICFKLNSLDFSTLGERIKADSGISKVKATILTFGLRLLKPLILSSKPDVKVFFFNENNAGTTLP
jgi:SAM-dependent methyltransferase